MREEETPAASPKVGIRVADRPAIANVYHPDCGDVIGGYKLVGQLDVVSAEADLWIAENNGREFVCKLYRHGVTSGLVASGALLALDHPHLLPTRSTGDHLGRQYEITPFYSGGSLEKRLAHGATLSLEDAETVLRQLAQGLTYLHGHGVQHRDIKPGNILLKQTSPLEVALSDFGRSEETSSTMLTLSRGTLLYSAPEAVNGLFSPASDWWSVGMVLLEALAGRHPLSHLPANQQHYAIVAGNIPIPESLPERWQALFQGLLVVDHTQRWGAEQVDWWLKYTANNQSLAEVLPKRRFATPTVIAFLSLPFLVIATRFLGPIVEEFMGLLFVVWLLAALGIVLWKKFHK